MQRTEAKVIYNKTIMPINGFNWRYVIYFDLKYKNYISQET